MFMCMWASCISSMVQPSSTSIWYQTISLILYQLTTAGTQLKAFEPGLSPELAETCQHAKMYAQEGWCDPAEATQAFLQEAQASGAQVLYSQQVGGWVCAGGTGSGGGGQVG